MPARWPTAWPAPRCVPGQTASAAWPQDDPHLSPHRIATGGVPVGGSEYEWGKTRNMQKKGNNIYVYINIYLYIQHTHVCVYKQMASVHEQRAFLPHPPQPTLTLPSSPPVQWSAARGGQDPDRRGTSTVGFACLPPLLWEPPCALHFTSRRMTRCRRSRWQGPPSCWLGATNGGQQHGEGILRRGFGGVGGGRWGVKAHWVFACRQSSKTIPNRCRTRLQNGAFDHQQRNGTGFGEVHSLLSAFDVCECAFLMPSFYTTAYKIKKNKIIIIRRAVPL